VIDTEAAPPSADRQAMYARRETKINYSSGSTQRFKFTYNYTGSVQDCRYRGL